MRWIFGHGNNRISTMLAVICFIGVLMQAYPAAAASKGGYWAVAYRMAGSGWGAAKAQTRQEAIKLAKEKCNKIKPRPGRYTNCILSQAYSIDENACVHLFEAFNSSFALFVGSSYGARTGNAANEAAKEAHTRCLNTPGFTSSICGAFVRPNQTATYCSKQFR